jgi:hypothetical protein
MSVLIRFTIVPNDSYIEYLHHVSFSLDLSILVYSAHTVEIPSLFNVFVYVLDIFYWPPACVVRRTMASSSGFSAGSETATVVKAEEYLVD